MITLTSLSTQLDDQFYSANLAAVPTATRTEAIRQALCQINAAFTTAYTISGLDGASATTLPESYVSALLLGASALVMDFSIRSRFVGYHDTPEVSEKLVEWAEKMKKDFEVALERMRLVELQQATNAPAFQINDDVDSYKIFLDS